MTASSIRYLFKEGFRNTWTNRMMSIASICVLMSCLVLMGCATMIFLNIDSLLGRIEEENVVMVYIEDDTTASDLKQMEKSLNEIRNIKEVEFIAKEVAWQQQLDTMEESHAAYFILYLHLFRRLFLYRNHLLNRKYPQPLRQA